MKWTILLLFFINNSFAQDTYFGVKLGDFSLCPERYTDSGFEARICLSDSVVFNQDISEYRKNGSIVSFKKPDGSADIFYSLVMDDYATLFYLNLKEGAPPILIDVLDIFPPHDDPDHSQLEGFKDFIIIYAGGEYHLMTNVVVKDGLVVGAGSNSGIRNISDLLRKKMNTNK